jgi:hypothetical protein
MDLLERDTRSAVQHSTAFGTGRPAPACPVARKNIPKVATKKFVGLLTGRAKFCFPAGFSQLAHGPTDTKAE